MFLLYLEIEEDWTVFNATDLMLFENEDEVKEKQKQLTEWAKKYFDCRFKRLESSILKEIKESFPKFLMQSERDILSIIHSLETCESYEFNYKTIPVYKKEME